MNQRKERGSAHGHNRSGGTLRARCDVLTGGSVSVRKVVGVVTLLLCAASAAAQEAEVLFPRPAELQPAVRFWTRVYTEIDTSSGFLHDPVNLDVVYETLRFAPNPSSRERRRATARATERYSAILTKLASDDRSALDTDEARVLALWPAGTSRSELRAAAGRIRFQLGQADRFKAGLERSGRWKAYIEQVLAEKGVPRELASLPHVESSFDPTAYSKVGAAGLWQFTRSTGLRYMQIDHIVDERRDPFLSTHAAAQLLSDNYSVIQSWPLAITAYNHGLAGMRRAAEQQKTTDIGVIVHNYKSRIFGFASRNFYAAFLAAVDVDANYERYFGPLDIDSPENLAVVVTPDYAEASTIAQTLNLSARELERLNPALMETVWAGDKLVPRGFELRVPARAGTDPAILLAGIPNEARFAAQRPDLQHRVRSGETLSVIAQRYRVSVASLIRANGLNNRGFIRAGQVLNLPQAASAPAAVSVAAAATEVAEPPGGEYVVQHGDSIDRIARRFGIDQAELLSANEIYDRNRIYVGQVLRLPGEDGVLEDAAQILPAVAAVVADTLLPPAAADDRASVTRGSRRSRRTSPLQSSPSRLRRPRRSRRSRRSRAHRLCLSRMFPRSPPTTYPCPCSTSRMPKPTSNRTYSRARRRRSPQTRATTRWPPTERSRCTTSRPWGITRTGWKSVRSGFATATACRSTAPWSTTGTRSTSTSAASTMRRCT